MGHKFIGVIEEVGSEVYTLTRGDFVIGPFAYSDGTCDFCRDGLQTYCWYGGFWARGDVGGAQAEAIRVPLADGTLVKAPGRRGVRPPTLAADPLRRVPYQPPRGLSSCRRLHERDA
jgi:threonine dehydrogenase-like Zn-dependent dehydrogenase